MIHLVITTPEKKLFDGEVGSVTLPTTTGEIMVLENHKPLMTILGDGDIIMDADDVTQTQSLAVVGGFVRVANNHVTILADFAQHLHDISPEEVDRLQKEAEEAMNNYEELSEEEARLYEHQLRRALVYKASMKRWRNLK